MIINFSNEVVNMGLNGEKSLFLAGPTLRLYEAVEGDVSWRIEALDILKELGFKGIVYVPEHSDGSKMDDYDDQVEWEFLALSRAKKIVFWVPREKQKLQGFTTNVEFGSWIHSGKIIYGRPECAYKTKYLDWLYKKIYKKDAHNDLREMLVDVVNIFKEEDECSANVIKNASRR